MPGQVKAISPYPRVKGSYPKYPARPETTTTQGLDPPYLLPCPLHPFLRLTSRSLVHYVCVCEHSVFVCVSECVKVHDVSLCGRWLV